MPTVYRADLLYTTYKDEARALDENPFVRREPILVDCPCGCGVKYNLVEDVNATDSEIEEHKRQLIEILKRHLPDHPGKVNL